MIAAIISVPERLDVAKNIKKITDTFARKTITITDEEYKGCTFNSLRTLQHAITITNDGEWIFITTDDILFRKNFHERLSDVLDSATTNIVCLNYHIKENLPENSDNSTTFFGRSSKDFCDVGWCIKKNNSTVDIVFDIVNYYFNRIHKSPMPSFGVMSKHFDHQVGNYLHNNGIKWSVVFEALTKHNIEVPSALGHTYNNAADGFSDEEILSYDNT